MKDKTIKTLQEIFLAGILTVVATGTCYQYSYSHKEKRPTAVPTTQPTQPYKRIDFPSPEPKPVYASINPREDYARR